MHRTPKCAVNQQGTMLALLRDQNVESMRKYLIQFDFFPLGRDGNSCPIGWDELKELVKHWKLHRRRNFWRENTTKEDLARVLDEHVSELDAAKRRRQKARAQRQAALLAEAGEELPRPGTPLIAGASKPTTPATEEGSQLESIGSSAKDAKAMEALGSLIPLAGAFRGENSNLASLPGDCLLYMSRAGQHGAGKRNPAIITPRQTEREAAEAELAMLSLEALTPRTAGNGTVGGASTVLMLTPGGAGGGDPMRRKLAEGLCSVAFRDAGAVLSNRAAFKTLLDLSRDDRDDDVVLSAAYSLANCTVDAESRTQLMASGGLVALFDLSVHPSLQIRELAATALSRLAADRTLQIALVRQSAVTFFKDLLKNDSNKAIECACVSSIINLAAQPGGTMDDIAVATLLSLSADSKDRDVRGVVEAALANLSILSCSRANIVDTGAVGILKNMVGTKAVRAGTPSTADADARATVAHVLCNLTTMKINQPEMIKQQVDRVVHVLVEGADCIGREYLSLALANFACHERYHEVLATDPKAVGLKDLVALAKGPPDLASIDTKANVSCALSNLACSPDCCLALVEAGALKTLQALLEEDTLEIKKDAVIALCYLVVNEDTKGAAIEAGVISSLVSLADEEDPLLKSVCALALFNMACSKEIHDTLILQRGVTAMTTLLQSRVVEIERYCCMALYNLSGSDLGSEEIINEGSVSVLVTVASRDDTDVGVKKLAAATLYNLSNAAPTRAMLVADGAALCLIRLASIPSPECQVCCAGGLANLCEVEDTLDQDIIPCLIALAAAEEFDTLVRVASAFEYLSGVGRARTLMAKQPTMPHVFNALMRCGHEDTQVRSATALVNMSSTPSWVWVEGALRDFIVIALLRTNSQVTKLLCTKVLFNVLVSEDRIRFIDEGVLYALKRMSALDNEEVHAVVVAGLYNLSCDERYHPALLDTGVVATLRDLAAKSTETTLRQDMALTFANLSAIRGAEQQMVREGALAAVKLLLRQRDLETRLALIRFIANASAAEDVRAALTSDTGVLPGVVLLVRSDHEELRRLGCLALANISASAATHPALAKGGAMQALIQVLDRTENPETLRLCAKTLRNVLVHHQEYSQIIVASQGIEKLVKLMETTKDVETSNHCARMCFVMGTVIDEQLLTSMIDDNIMSGLSAMAGLLDDDTAVAETMIAVANLSTHRVRHGILVEGGIAACISALASKGVMSEAFKINCSTAIRNLTTTEAARPALVNQRGLVGVLLDMAAADDVKTRRNVAAAIYNAVCCGPVEAKKLLVKRDGMKILVELAEKGDDFIKSLASITLQACSELATEAGVVDPALAKRLVTVMLWMNNDPGAPTAAGSELVAADLEGAAGIPTLSPGSRGPEWYAHPEAAWPVAVIETTTKRMKMDAVNVLASEDVEPAPPRVLMLDDASLISGKFGNMEVPLVKVARVEAEDFSGVSLPAL